MLWIFLLLLIGIGYGFQLKNQLQAWSDDVHRDLEALIATIERRNDHTRFFLKTLSEQSIQEDSAIQALTQALQSWDSARKSGIIDELAPLANTIHQTLMQLLDRLGQYSALQDQTEVHRLLAGFPTLSEAIDARITAYNQHTEFYNQSIKSFPHGMLASFFVLKPQKRWEKMAR